MILGAEIGMLIFGLLALIRGKLTLTKKRVIQGPMARVLAIIAMLPMPISLGIGVIVGFAMAAQGKQFDPNEMRGTFALVELGVIVACLVAIYAIGWSWAESPDQQLPDAQPADQ